MYVNLPPIAQTGRPPLAGYPYLLVQYKPSCTLYLEAVSRIGNLRKSRSIVRADSSAPKIFTAPVSVILIAEKSVSE
jgi:hypothetical protein